MALAPWGILILTLRAKMKRMAKKPQPNSSVKYAGIGFQLVALTLVLILSGLWLDAYFQSGNVYLLISIFLSVFSTMYLLISKLK
jgi:hypothetical protein